MPRRSRALNSGAASTVRLVAVAAVAGVLAHAVANALLEAMPGIDGAARDLGESGLLLPITGAFVYLLAVKPLRDALRREESATAARESQLRTEVDRKDFDGRLTRALDMSDSEADVLTVTEQALGLVNPSVASELLLADASGLHLERVAARRGEAQLSGCSVESPQACPAIRGGRTLTFASSAELDACPRLWGRSEEPVAAACIPVAVAGTASGVLHVVTPCDKAVSADEVARLESVSSQVGARVGLLRALEQSQLQAATDSLTGLPNRRSIESRARDMWLRGGRFALVMADLDRFKALNDTFGHHAGDRALRLFAEVARSSLRPNDMIARFGGEEFLLLLPGTLAGEAAAAVERIRESLVLALTDGVAPGFTASFGVSDTTMHADLDVLVRLADAALFEAKRMGRDRAVVARIDLLDEVGPSSDFPRAF